MRTYNTQHLHYCGIDLHARSLSPRRAVWHRRGGTVPCHTPRCEANERTIPMQPGDANRHTCGVQLRATRPGNASGRAFNPTQEFRFHSSSHAGAGTLKR